MNLKLYQFLVNKQPGIKYRYHKMHDGSTGVVKLLSWGYLLWINICYYLFFCRFLGKVPEMEIYEKKQLNIKMSESQEHCANKKYRNVSEYVEKLSVYDVISFDVFDTLIFRPVALPTDIFYMVGQGFDILDFKNIRVWAEWDARMRCKYLNGHTEVTFADIWSNLEKESNVPAEAGMEKEEYIEQMLCYANPFMLEVWKELIRRKKRIVIISDMYLSREFIEKILIKAGFVGAEQIYVSSEYALNKAGGTLFDKVISDLFQTDKKVAKLDRGIDISRSNAKLNQRKNRFSMVHVGDNPRSDYQMAMGQGIDVFPYQNVNKNILVYRAMDMSSMIGGAYRGLVSNHLYNGLKSYSVDYEYGYIYGGLFVLGYCSFIHEYCSKNRVDKILFLSRDGDTLMQAYQKLFPEDQVAYAYWSRKASTKLMADEDKHDYFRRFLYHKVNQKITIKEILCSMELEELVCELSDWKQIWLSVKEEEAYQNKENDFIDLMASDELTDKNVGGLRCFIEAKWNQVLAIYENQQAAAGKYYGNLLKDCNKVVAVDIGWAGSGALALSHLSKHVWKLGCEIIGVIAGTNTIHNAEPDAADPFLQDGRLVSYLYSGMENRELLKKHNPSKDYNVFWELLLSSPTPQFVGFYDGNQNECMGKEHTYDKEQDITLDFGKYDANQDGIKEIQRGILDFVEQYRLHFGDPVSGEFSYMYRISGRDAYAPMLVAASYEERYLKMIKKRYDLEINVN